MSKEMETVESIITYIRNILRQEGITGMDSINHCLLLIIMRYLDEKLCKKLNIPEIYNFENIFEYIDEKKIDNQKTYNKIYMKNQECLLKHIVTNFKFTQFNTFKITSPINLEKIIHKLKELNINKLSLKFDIVGIIYELHLKTGSSNAMRDLGQYFTNRLLIDYMVKLCDPKLKKNKQIETILDPSMGTAGFLTMSIKYLNNKYKNIDWNINKSNIIGFDIDENVRSMALINLLLETDVNFNDTLIKHDTLKSDYKLSEKVLIDKVDVILANEPFGLKNIIYTECCERIRELKIRGTKSEPLFLQLMMISLNKDGRCAVIVPDGVLFNEAKLHKETRKYLIENLNLKKVVSLDGDFFLNTGVKSSILYFVNNGQTKETEFCKVKLENNDINEALIVKATYDDIKNNKYSLFVNKYIKVEEKVYQNIEFKKIEDICIFFPKSKRLASYGKTNGTYKFYTSSNDHKYCDDADFNKESIIIGAGGNCNINYDNKFSCSMDTFILNSETVLNKYIYYFLKNNINILENGFKGSTIKHISKEYIQNIQIPIPGVETQNSIVSFFDNIYNSIELNKKLIDNYEITKKQIIQSILLHIKTDKKLEDICDIKFGTRIKKSDVEIDEKYTGEKYPCYGGGDISFYMKEYNREGLNLVISRFGLSEKCVRIINDKFWLNDSGMTIHTKDEKLYLQKYINYYIHENLQHTIYSMAQGACQKNIDIDGFKNILIPIPSLETQKYIIEQCEFFNEQINILKFNNEKLFNTKYMDIFLLSSNDNKDEVK